MLSNRARLLIVMEMMEGGELFHRISQHRHFTEKQASQVTKQASQRWGGESGALILWLSSPIAPGKKAERKALFDLSLPALL